MITYVLQRDQLKALMMAAAAHAPTFQAAEQVVDKVLTDYDEEGSIVRTLVDSLNVDHQ